MQDIWTDVQTWVKLNALNDKWQGHKNNKILLEFLDGHLSHADPQAAAKAQQQSVLDKVTVEV